MSKLMDNTFAFQSYMSDLADKSLFLRIQAAKVTANSGGLGDYLSRTGPSLDFVVCSIYELREANLCKLRLALPLHKKRKSIGFLFAF